MFQFKEIFAEIKETLLLIGNWKNFPNGLLEAKCFYKDVKIWPLNYN